jgi:hypothetical protein
MIFHFDLASETGGNGFACAPGAALARIVWLSASFPAKTRIFEPFVYKNDHFAKTGSGQT